MITALIALVWVIDGVLALLGLSLIVAAIRGHHLTLTTSIVLGSLGLIALFCAMFFTQFLIGWHIVL